MIKQSRLTVLLATGLCLALAGSASAAKKKTPASAAPPASASPATGGQEFGESNLADVPVAGGSKARLLSSGKAAAPADAPEEVKEAIWAANRIIGKPYRYGGGHAKFEDSGYDCSGTVSYALRGAGVLTWLIPDRVAVWVLLALVLLVPVLGPVWVLIALLAVTFTLGLGDTWRDFRADAAARRPSSR